MIRHSASSYRRACLRSVAGGLLILAAACGDGAGPSSETVPTAAAPGGTASPDTAVAPPDTTVIVPGDSGLRNPDSTLMGPTDSAAGVVPTTDPTSVAPGIVFGTIDMETPQFSSMHTGSVLGGGLDPSNALTQLAQTRAKGARVVIKLCRGRDSFVKNADGTFSLTKWKALVARYQSVNIAPYIADGTIIGHWLIDEPHIARRWGGKIISQATLEAMAQYSKQLWPTMTTFVRVVPSWLAAAPITYKYLDAGWLQYTASRGNVATVLASEVAAAKSRGLGLMVGMNVLAGGNGSSGVRDGNLGWNMSASELTSYGTTLLNQTYACGFFMWAWDPGYYGQSNIKSAMAGLSAQAKTHVKTSCKQ